MAHRWQEYFSRKGAKTQRRPPKTRQRFATLRLCARNILGKKHFLWKAPSESADDLPKDRRCTLAQLLASEHSPLFTTHTNND